jgi:hypothetical protein
MTGIGSKIWKISYPGFSKAAAVGNKAAATGNI